MIQYLTKLYITYHKYTTAVSGGQGTTVHDNTEIHIWNYSNMTLVVSDVRNRI